VHHVRTLADAVRLRADLVPGARLLAVGGGYVGLEVASVARQSGLAVTVLEAAPRLLARVAGAELASFAADLHRAAGVELRLGAQAAGYRTDGAGRVTGVVLDSGEVLPADVVVIGVGQVPRDELARGCGLETADGIVVDAHCRTADPRVYAVGDCTRHPCAQWGGLRRLESVANASAQGRVAAAAILGDPKPYTTVPWFWSTQYRRTLRTVGLRGASDTTVVRQGADGAFAAFHLAGGVLKAVDVVDGPRDFAAAKELVAAGARVAPDVLADPGVELRALAASL
jgi:3-phenylpropionate/trans-cinnamate dioxygenase ferredoxin reductase subunit